MVEAGVAAWIAVIGYLVMAPLWTRIGVFGLGAMALPVGAALYVLAGFALVLPGTFSTMGALLVSSVVAAAVAAATGREALSTRAVRRDILGALGIVVALAAVLALVFQAVHLTRLTVDSIRNLLSAEMLERTGALDALHRRDLRKRLFALPVLHAAGSVTGKGYVASVTPLFAVSGFAAAAWFGRQGLVAMGTPRRWRVVLITAAALLVLTTNRIVFNAFYVNGHMIFAVLAIIAVGSMWLAMLRKDWVLLWPAALALAVLPLLRAEAVITAAIFLVPAVASRRIPATVRMALVAPFVLATVLWYGVAYRPFAPETHLGLTGPVYGNILIAMVPAGIVLLTRVGRLGPMADRVTPWVVFAGAALYVAASGLDDSDILETSLSATGANVAFDGMWGVFWWVVPLLMAGALLVARPPFARLWTLPSLTYGVALFAFPYLRDGPYRVGTGDSGNRMLMHVTLVLVVFLVLSAGHAVLGSDED